MSCNPRGPARRRAPFTQLWLLRDLDPMEAERVVILPADEDRVGRGQPVAWAANVNFSGTDADRDFRRDTIDSLPDGGIVLVAVGPRAFEGATDFRDLSLPLSLADGRLVTGSYEGQPAPGLSYFYADQRFGDHAVLNVWGYLGGNPATATVRAEADHALATLSFEG
jgi:hypothetical protein